MSGRDFLGRYEKIADHVVEVHPDRTYNVRACTAHPVYEHARVKQFARLLDGSESNNRNKIEDVTQAGALMYESHAGYGTCGLGSEGTDKIVGLARRYGPANGLFGARITGGGSGGTVAILGLSESFAHVQEIAAAYERETGRVAQIFQSEDTETD
jgi:L-arabinokinase